MNICQKCSQTLELHVNFCPQCGAQVTQQDSHQTQDSQMLPRQQANTQAPTNTQSPQSTTPNISQADHIATDVATHITKSTQHIINSQNANTPQTQAPHVLQLNIISTQTLRLIIAFLAFILALSPFFPIISVNVLGLVESATLFELADVSKELGGATIIGILIIISMILTIIFTFLPPSQTIKRTLIAASAFPLLIWLIINLIVGTNDELSHYSAFWSYGSAYWIIFVFSLPLLFFTLVYFLRPAEHN
ncbi:MAG: zinc ribbon domain-containing protein, partial [Actinomycetaceae bacterium]|nr:zinc ribbon domain-containing protein [Actinomycetaceae bacterium]